MLRKSEALALCRGEHGDPFAVLGMHTDGKGRLWLRTMQPGASAVFVVETESGKEVLIDTILQEALSRRKKLKVWKEVALKADDLSGRSEYVFAQRLTVLTHPFVCLAEAKKDDFEQGAAQCVLGMKACQALNAKEHLVIDMHGIVTNAAAWQFYKLTVQDEVYQSPLYSFETQTPTLFGILDAIFAACEQYIES